MTGFAVGIYHALLGAHVPGGGGTVAGHLGMPAVLFGLYAGAPGFSGRS